MNSVKTKKRVFVGLLVLGIILVSGLILTGYLGFSNRTPYFHRFVEMVGTAVLVLVVIAVLGAIGLVITLWRVRSLPVLQNLILLVTNLLFPLALTVGRLFRIDQDVIKSSFIEVNNQIVRTRYVAAQPEQVMILAPSCLQSSTCGRKITIDINNCQRCGGCPISDLLEIVDNFGVHLVVATGGTLARKSVEQIRPLAIVAIACERDLSTGIQDTTPLPVMGVLNVRPQGPCFNTGVNLAAVEEAVCYFLDGKIRLGL